MTVKCRERSRQASRLGLHHTQLPITGEGSDMKANLKTSILPLLTAAISCALSLAAGATDHGSSDRHYSSNFTPIVNEVRKVVLSHAEGDSGQVRLGAAGRRA